MNNWENLAKMSREELVELHVKVTGVKPHHKAKPETIIKNIKDATFNKQDAPKVEEKAAPPKVADHNTPEDVEKAIESIKAKRPEFTANYNTQENTWTFECMGAKESGNLDIPLRVIVQKATNISRGRLVMMGMSEFEALTGGNPNSAYANKTVLRG